MIETKSAAVAITLATLRGHQSAGSSHELYGCRIQHQGAGNTSGEVAHGVDCGRVLATVDRQREPVRCWLYAAYAEPAWKWITYDMLKCLHFTLRDEWRSRCDAKISESRESALLRCVINDKRLSLNNQDHAMKPGDYTSAIGIPKESWSRYYRAFARQASEIIDDWDREGRIAVARELQGKIAEKVDYQEIMSETT